MLLESYSKSDNVIYSIGCIDYCVRIYCLDNLFFLIKKKKRKKICKVSKWLFLLFCKNRNLSVSK